MTDYKNLPISPVTNEKIFVKLQYYNKQKILSKIDFKQVINIIRKIII